MVKSGLVNNPNVSHLRLASHLGLAFTIFALILWQYLATIRFDFKKQSSPPFQPLLYGVSVAIVIQIMYGAFTAGLNAGYYFNTYPKMGPFWVPPSIFMFDGFINNLLNNPILVQWVHRWLAALVIIGVISIWQGCKKRTKQTFHYKSVDYVYLVNGSSVYIRNTNLINNRMVTTSHCPSIWRTNADYMHDTHPLFFSIH